MNWGQVIFATVTPLICGVIAILVRLSARLAIAEQDARDAKHDVRDLYKKLIGYGAPSELRDRSGNKEDKA